MKIVVLDGYTLNPGDQSWSELEALGECQFYDRTDASELIDRAQGYDIVITNKVVLGRGVLERLPRLRYIGVTATGYNVVDVAAARERGVIVANVPVYGTRSVAQLTFALILELAHHVGVHTDSVRRGDWARCSDFAYWTSQQVELEGKTLGVVGWGRIGRAVGELGSAFGMQVIAATRSASALPEEGVRHVTVDDVFGLSDIVSLHCPLTDQTRHIVNRSRLALMKREAWLINTSRGSLVDEVALAEALHSDSIGGAALDVLSVEPPPADHPLLAAKHCIITPHMAWATLAARRRLMSTTVDNIRNFLAGHPTNVVNL
jgi:glycerate dehydrogenase